MLGASRESITKGEAKPRMLKARGGVAAVVEAEE